MNNSYEMGVEFYSLQNLPYYLIFMDKIGKLYQRHDVKVVIEASNWSFLNKYEWFFTGTREAIFYILIIIGNQGGFMAEFNINA